MATLDELRVSGARGAAVHVDAGGYDSAQCKVIALDFRLDHPPYRGRPGHFEVVPVVAGCRPGGGLLLADPTLDPFFDLPPCVAWDGDGGAAVVDMA
eukprot:gene15667-49022_t